MNIPVERRFVELPEVVEARHTLDQALANLQQDLSKLTTASDGVIFAIRDEHYPDDIGVISDVKSEESSRQQKNFSKHNVEFRRIQLAGTALSESLGERNPIFIQSAMQPERHMTWGTRLNAEREAAIQIAFDVERGILPSNDEMNSLWSDHQASLNHAYQPFERIKQQTPNILGRLELAPPTTPNAFALRWDITGSTAMALSQPGTYQAYLDHWKRDVHKALGNTEHSMSDIGDWQNLIIPLAGRNPFYIDGLRYLRDHTVLPLAHRLMDNHDLIAAQYDSLSPKARFAIGLGNVSNDDMNQKTGPVLYEVARSLKRPDGAITISQSAKLGN